MRLDALSAYGIYAKMYKFLNNRRVDPDKINFDPSSPSKDGMEQDINPSHATDPSGHSFLLKNGMAEA